MNDPYKEKEENKVDIFYTPLPDAQEEIDKVH